MHRISPRGIVHVQGQTALLSSRQDAEYMLCSACEARFAKREDYFSRVAMQANGSFPANDVVIELPGTAIVGHGSAGDASALNCDDLTYFASSVVWRASKSPLYPTVSLGADYEQQFGEYLLDRAPFPAAALLLVELMRPEPKLNLPSVARSIIPPHSDRVDQCRRHCFTIGGLQFRLYVGRNMAPSHTPLSFLQHRRVLITDGHRLALAAAKRVQGATPKGALANGKKL